MWNSSSPKLILILSDENATLELICSAKSLTNFSLHLNLWKSEIKDLDQRSQFFYYFPKFFHESYDRSRDWEVSNFFPGLWEIRFFGAIFLGSNFHPCCSLRFFHLCWEVSNFFPGLWEKPNTSSPSLLCLGEANPVRFQPATISTKHTTQTLHNTDTKKEEEAQGFLSEIKGR